MTPRLTFPAVILAVAVPGFGSGMLPSPPQLRGAESALRINGTERLGWEQPSRAHEMTTIRFAAVVDSRKVPLPDATCLATNDPRMFVCSSPVPAMATGPHSIQLVAIDGGRESRPSKPPMSVILEPGAKLQNE
jgi:hypothetical protein